MLLVGLPLFLVSAFAPGELEVNWVVISRIIWLHSTEGWRSSEAATTLDLVLDRVATGDLLVFELEGTRKAGERERERVGKLIF